MSISPAIAALIARMDEHPEEFVNATWNPVFHIDDFLFKTRWRSISDLMSATDSIFTSEEVIAYMGKLTEILRARTNEAIIKELVGQEQLKALSDAETYRAKQLKLPLGTSMVNATQPKSLLAFTDHVQDALKIIGDTYK